MESATKLLWIEYWACNVDPNYKYAIIQDEKQKDGTWVVKAKIPYYENLVIKKSEKLMEAVISVADEVCDIIDKLIAKNPSLFVENKYLDGHWQIVVDNDGEGYTIAQSDEYYKETQEICQNLIESLSNQAETILHTITRWVGSTDLAFLHIFDKRLLGNNNKEIMINMRKLIKKLHTDKINSARTFISGNSVISFGFKMSIN